MPSIFERLLNQGSFLCRPAGPPGVFSSPAADPPAHACGAELFSHPAASWAAYCAGYVDWGALAGVLTMTSEGLHGETLRRLRSS